MEMVVIEVVVKVVVTLILTALSVLGAWLTAKIAQKKELENINIAKDEVINIAAMTVQELQQTVVEELKASAEDGKLNTDEIKMLGTLLVEKSIEKMSAPTEALLRGAGVDLEKLIIGAGEAWIARMKR